ncbi:alpha-L-fucosidase 2 [Friedmanniella endophytica]|uniref:Alpha-L-fucosidase 2 n=1 Tax=Microlunatus kandeliicorticis TaxID=1759536 RepID=A0A7W3IQW8_9ACTN|nr:glycoside hydrolase family 95 protein [Microlunatus kandeliicorticis]MBA8793577.1 alpha-L-fucosidase 2 [Microlunatus kandeliicorticis]
MAQTSDESTDRLWYDAPARDWNAALPVGNGHLGAMVFGRPGRERLQLNEDTLWSGGPYRNDNPAAGPEALAEVRRLVDAGEYRAAQDRADATLLGVPLRNASYGSLGDLFVRLDQPGRTPDEPASDYRRELDLGTAVAGTRWGSDGRRTTAETFVSAPDQLLVHRITADQPFGLRLGYRGARAVPGVDPMGDTAATGPAAAPVWDPAEDLPPLAAGVRVRADGADRVLVTGPGADHVVDDHTVPGALSWAIGVRVVTDGVVTTRDPDEERATDEGVSPLEVADATWVALLVAAATSHVGYDDVSGDPVAVVRTRTAAPGEVLDPAGLDRLRERHVADHRGYYDRFAVDLGPAPDRPTDERVRNGEDGADPALHALYLQYARYLLIASSRPGSQPANLQGIWNEGLTPPWGSKWTININTEMNYWPADAAGLGDLVAPLLALVEDLAVTGAPTARAMYGARGWVAHHNTDLWRATAPVDGAPWGLWPTGGAWLCTTLWQHWRYRRDPDELARLYPVLRGASEFFLDTLVEDPGGRGLITSPSVSPENQHPYGSSVAAGPAMDRQLVVDLLTATAEAAALLDRDHELAALLRATAARIVPDRIGAQGQLQEWLEDWDADAPEQHHRHVSHLYAVYPGGRISTETTPELAAAARVSLDQRGDYATGWGTAWRACLWARLGDGERAHRVLCGLVGPQRTYPNLFDAHPPFQIDGNFGGAAAMLELLARADERTLWLFPALPSGWPTGSVRGLCAVGGLEVDLRWRDGALTGAEVRGTPGRPLAVRTPTGRHEVELDADGRWVLG